MLLWHVGAGCRACLAAERPALICGVSSSFGWCRGVTLCLCDMAIEDEEYQRCIVELIWCLVLCSCVIPCFTCPLVFLEQGITSTVVYRFVENVLCSHHPPQAPPFVLWYSGGGVGCKSRWNWATWFGYYLSGVFEGIGATRMLCHMCVCQCEFGFGVVSRRAGEVIGECPLRPVALGAYILMHLILLTAPRALAAL